jgi:hypothetical protein
MTTGKAGIALPGIEAGGKGSRVDAGLGLSGSGPQGPMRSIGVSGRSAARGKLDSAVPTSGSARPRKGDLKTIRTPFKGLGQILGHPHFRTKSFSHDQMISLSTGLSASSHVHQQLILCIRKCPTAHHISSKPESHQIIQVR